MMTTRCLTDVSPGKILLDPFNDGNDENGANDLAFGYASLTSGCAARSAQYVRFEHSPGGNQPMTVGDVLFYPGNRHDFTTQLNREWNKREEIKKDWGQGKAAEFGPDLEKHEAIHSHQWASFSSASFFVTAYAVESGRSVVRVGGPWPAHANKYEL
ncbi:hypothetical protein [Streptomyces sp. WM4235]|uniref:hypothetical protein n=1 Tax=Streptomyces sp. WM4235 TaxID=1415551 RepID=UPI00131CA9E5|nr:hypothetical protein [Streptomyces sp. WM4235]